MEPADTITGYPQIDLIASDALLRLSERDRSEMRKKLQRGAELFRKRSHQIGDHRSLLHTLGELRLGAILANLGCAIAYERKYRVRINDKDEDRTPDWTVCRRDGEISCILDLANFHGDGRFEEALLGGAPARLPSDESVLTSLYTSMQDKSLRYRELAEQLQVPLIVAVYIHFTATWNIDPDKVRDLCCVGDHGLFYRFPEVSGYLHFAEGGARRTFYEKNPKALRDLSIPGGLL
jgi:hypothetical protein